MKATIVVAFPCYNEAPNIAGLLDRYIALLGSAESSNTPFDCKIFLIDDGSADETRKIAATYLDRLPLTIDGFSENRGLTAAILRAFEIFSQHTKNNDSPTAFVFMDGDNSHDPQVIPALLSKLNMGFDVVIASRFQRGSKVFGVPWFRSCLTYGMAVLYVLGRHIPGVRDYSCGFRMYSPETINRLFLRFGSTLVTEKSFACMVELLVKCHLVGARCAEVPFELHYERKGGRSKMNLLKTIFGSLHVLFRQFQ